MSYQVITPRAPQVVIDQAALQQLQADLGRRIADLERLRTAIETLSAMNDAERFQAAAMALVNQLASRWQAERASLGFLKGRYVKLAALSHTEKFTRQMRLVQDLEAAMEECLDQDVEVIVPPVPSANYVSRSTETLATRHGPSSVVSFPLRRKGDVVAVLLLERKVDKPFAPDEIETLRLTADLATARLVNLHDYDKWIGAKVAGSLREALALAVGPKHTWIKATAIAVCGVTLFAILVPGTWNVSGEATLQAVEKQTVPAKIEAQLRSARAQVGDFVVSEQTEKAFDELGEVFGLLPSPLKMGCLDSTLATLDTLEYQKKLTSARQEQSAALKEADIARRDNKEADAQVKELEAKKAEAQIQLLEWQINQATIKSPIDGIVFTGDLKEHLGRVIKQGDPLFEIGQIEKLRGEIQVPEGDISYVKVDSPGDIWLQSYPGHAMPFTVERINPAAELVKDKNIYRVRVKLDPAKVEPWMRPGMEGQGKVRVGKASYGWMWTRKAYNWVRMQWWMWF